MTDILGRLSSLGELFNLGGDALIELMAGIVQGLGMGTEFTGEQLDRLGELFQEGAEKVRGLTGAKEEKA